MNKKSKIDHLENREKECQNEIVRYENLIKELREETFKIKKEIELLKISHVPLDLGKLLVAIKNLGINVPNDFIIYNTFMPDNYEGSTDYILKYNGNEFVIKAFPYSDYPYIFYINGYCCYTDTIDNRVWHYTLAQIYYKYPDDIKSLNSHCKDEMNTISTAIVRAKNIMGDKWSDDFTFGIIIFHYWIRIYLRDEKHRFKELHDIFEETI